MLRDGTRVEDHYTPWNNVVETKTHIILFIDVPSLQVDVTVLKYQGVRLDGVNIFFFMTRRTIQQLNLTAPLHRQFDLSHSLWTVSYTHLTLPTNREV